MAPHKERTGWQFLELHQEPKPHLSCPASAEVVGLEEKQEDSPVSGVGMEVFLQGCGKGCAQTDREIMGLLASVELKLPETQLPKSEEVLIPVLSYHLESGPSVNWLHIQPL